ncbi:hypothetical protein FRX31_003026 [Thalictrum thalictroides]|uniref:Uncharacterized protein n=1 Tax=Thalictrum thalictroides TaxID=46969 RepID=A0A7J6XEE3_THATH|nr:hypothetical protein FRX31_003026 [Thalictrum thalictroides]
MFYPKSALRNNFNQLWNQLGKETIEYFTLGYISVKDSMTGDNETRESFSNTCSDETESQKSWRWEGSSGHEFGIRMIELVIFIFHI